MGTPIEGNTSETTDPAGQVQGNPETPGPNPAWNDVLSVLPEQFHSVVTPHFQKWDQAANSRIESLNTQYEPYKAFVDHGIDSEQIQQSLRIAQMINENPQAVYEALAESLKIPLGNETQQQQPKPEGEGNTDAAAQYSLPPGYEKLEQGVELMAQQMLMQQQAAENQAAANTLENDLQAVREKHGDFNEKHFLPYLSNAIDRGLNTAQAAEEFFAMRNEMIQGAQASQPYAPRILGSNSGSGAGLPSNAIDVTKLDDKGTRNLVVEYLKAAQANN